MRIPIDATSTSGPGLGGNAVNTTGADGMMLISLSSGLRARIDNINFGPTTDFDPLDPSTNTGEWSWVAVTYGDNGSQDQLDIYQKSTDAAIPFTNAFSQNTAGVQGLNITAELPYLIGKQGTSTTYKHMDFRLVTMYNKRMTSAEIEALFVD